MLALFLLVKAAGYWIGRYELLLASYGAVFGAGYTVTHVTLPFQWVLVAAALAGAGLAAANVRAQGWRLPVAAVVVVFGDGNRPRRSCPICSSACACAPTSSAWSGPTSRRTSR